MSRSLVFFLIVAPATVAFLLGMIAYAAQSMAKKLPDNKVEAMP